MHIPETLYGRSVITGIHPTCIHVNHNHTDHLAPGRGYTHRDKEIGYTHTNMSTTHSVLLGTHRDQGTTEKSGSKNRGGCKVVGSHTKWRPYYRYMVHMYIVYQLPVGLASPRLTQRPRKLSYCGYTACLHPPDLFSQGQGEDPLITYRSNFTRLGISFLPPAFLLYLAVVPTKRQLNLAATTLEQPRYSADMEEVEWVPDLHLQTLSTGP